MAGDIAPTAQAPVLIASDDKVVAEFQRWGITGWRSGLMINTRAETVCEKPMFRKKHGCAALCDSYQWVL